MTDSLTTITSDQKDALQLVELVERFISYGGMYSDNALKLAQDHLVAFTARGSSSSERNLVAAAVEFLLTCKGD